jgi:protein SCO1/2
MGDRRTARHGVQLSIALSLGGMLIGASSTQASETTPADYRQYEIGRLQQPLQADCAARHGGVLAPRETQENAALSRISMTGNDRREARSGAQATGSYSASYGSYSAPDVMLISEKGEREHILDQLNGDKPVLLNFIFTTCTTICPVLSASFKQVQELLGEEKDRFSMISISIDPEYDNAQRLSDYAERFDAGDQWRFYTGRREDVIAVQKAFDIYRGAKVNHEPVTLLRAGKGGPWLRIEGFADAGDIISEYRRLAGGQVSSR